MLAKLVKMKTVMVVMLVVRIVMKIIMTVMLFTSGGFRTSALRCLGGW